MIRIGVCLFAVATASVIVGCAGQPTHPTAAAAPPVTSQPAVATQVAASNAPVTRQVPVDASNVAEVQRAGYKIVNKDGVKLFCRTDPITGSRVRTVTTCLTEQELYDQMREMQQAMDQINSHQAGPAGK
jgi:hypothetical protein